MILIRWAAMWVNQFGHLPGRGEQVTIGSLEFTVLRAE